VPEPQLGAIQLLAQRDDDVARFERSRRRARQQRRVEHEVHVVDERDLRALPGHEALELAGGVQAAEAAPGDDDAMSHAARGRYPGAARAINAARGPRSPRAPRDTPGRR
jgi:hypothetical protein